MRGSTGSSVRTESANRCAPAVITAMSSSSTARKAGWLVAGAEILPGVEFGNSRLAGGFENVPGVEFGNSRLAGGFENVPGVEFGDSRLAAGGFEILPGVEFGNSRLSTSGRWRNGVRGRP
jgi:hypothetical protein